MTLFTGGSGGGNFLPSPPACVCPQRCRSQPSMFLHRGGGEGERKGSAKKRRHEYDDRPTVDFLKMKEVLY